jgi:hypothetical protein
MTPAEWTYLRPRCFRARMSRDQREWGTTHEDLVEKVLDELFLERPGREKSVEIRAEEFGHKVSARQVSMQLDGKNAHAHVLLRGNKDVAKRDNLHRNQQMRRVNNNRNAHSHGQYV